MDFRIGIGGGFGYFGLPEDLGNLDCGDEYFI